MCALAHLGVVIDLIWVSLVTVSSGRGENLHTWMAMAHLDYPLAQFWLGGNFFHVRMVPWHVSWGDLFHVWLVTAHLGGPQHTGGRGGVNFSTSGWLCHHTWTVPLPHLDETQTPLWCRSIARGARLAPLDGTTAVTPNR